MNWIVLSRGKRARKANWDQIKNLKCQTDLFVGSKEGLENFEVGESQLHLSGNSERSELGSKEIIWKLVKQSRVEVTKSLNSHS